MPPAPRPATVPAAAIATDRSRYVMQAGPFGPEVTIRTTFRAPADRDVYLLHCNGALSVGVQQKVGSEWRNAWIAETNGCFSAPILVPAGGEHQTPMTVLSRAEAPDPAQRTETRIESGTYRAVWFGVVTSFEPRDPSKTVELPLGQRVSAPFTIENRVRP